MSWSSGQYSKFEHERNRPIRDLLFNIPLTTVNIAADIGCGPGNSTELLQTQFPHAKIMGMDSSENMIEAARKRMPGVRFEVDDISTWHNPGPYDVILANAALQWVPDHKTLFPALISKLAKGGCLAVQMPDNFEEPAHRLMRETATNGPWAVKLSEASKRIKRETAEWYYHNLRDKVTTLDIWRTVYHHPLQGGPAAIVEWFKGTGLRPFVEPLDDAERKAFLSQYEEGIAKAYPQYPDGSVLLPFPRLFIVATV
ncbi:trans-aconitate 2-methyltransferase [Mucilaginibacter sp. RCC_168]|uniref:trans-aconitate 2-methyltransferase n=1 Tax=Mucilaginibacter sp. RCC_168 TaxID=3239221 RepID=UPI0035260EDF